MLASRGGEINGWWLEVFPRKEVVAATKEIGVKEEDGLVFDLTQKKGGEKL